MTSSTDGLVRRRRTPKQRQQLLARFHQSQLTQRQFAIAPLPPQPIEQGMAGPGLLAQVLVSKYE
jgi:hypothetical protein